MIETKTELYEEVFEYYWPVFVQWLHDERMKQVLKIDNYINSNENYKLFCKIFACEFVPIIHKLEEQRLEGKDEQ